MVNTILETSKNGLAVNKVKEFENQPLGYGLTRKEVAQALNVPISQIDQVLKDQDHAVSVQEAYSPTGSGPAVTSDQLLQNIYAKKQADMNNAVANMHKNMDNSRAYHHAKQVAKPSMPSASDASFYAADGVDVYKGYNKAMDEYTKAQDVIKQYEANIDPVEAAKWRSSFLD